MIVRYRVLRSLRHWPWRLTAGPTAAGALAVVLYARGWLDALARLLAVVAIVGVAGPGVWWAVRWLAPALSTRTWVSRRDDGALHAGGVASALDVAQAAGRQALRARARTLRPSLRETGWWRLRITPSTAYGVVLARCGWLPWGSRVWSSCEDVTLRIGGPRTGKTGSMACHALDAPGALILTTTRTDLLELTAPVRSRRGRVDVFNPTGLGLLPSSVRWSALADCADLATARRRAGDLIPESTGEAERWDAQARGLLAILLHAAALSERSLAAVLDWVSPADEVALHQIVAALQHSPSARSLTAEVRSLYTTNDRTKTSITATLLPAVRWVTDATAAWIGDAALDDPDLLDVTRLVSGGTDSLYLIGREGPCRPLVGALTAEIAHQARMLAAAAPTGRLDPPLTLILDEAPLTCGPVPLHDWTADMGGRGVTIHVAAQSLAQLREVWGRERAGVILGNTAALLAFGGIKAADDLHDLSTLCGTRLVPLDEDDSRYVPVMTPGEIASLPAGHALILRNGLRPLIGRPPMAWSRHAARLRPLAQLLARALVWVWRSAGDAAVRAGLAVERALTVRAERRGATAGSMAPHDDTTHGTASEAEPDGVLADRQAEGPAR